MTIAFDCSSCYFLFLESYATNIHPTICQFFEQLSIAMHLRRKHNSMLVSFSRKFDFFVVRV
uniref:Ovule protein n=1 Tax=Heterorhabditis bacteriophora TaxID=37862 RepID=A0A1I7WW54_HETBA